VRFCANELWLNVTWSDIISIIHILTHLVQVGNKQNLDLLCSRPVLLPQPGKACKLVPCYDMGLLLWFISNVKCCHLMNDASPDDAACNNLTSHEGRQGCTNTARKYFEQVCCDVQDVINNTAVLRTKRKNPPRNKNVDYGQIQLLGFTAVA